MRDLLRITTFDGEVVIKKCLIGYAIYDCDSFLGWGLTLKSAKRYGRYLSGKF